MIWDPFEYAQARELVEQFWAAVCQDYRSRPPGTFDVTPWTPCKTKDRHGQYRWSFPQVPFSNDLVDLAREEVGRGGLRAAVALYDLWCMLNCFLWSKWTAEGFDQAAEFPPLKWGDHD